MAAGKKVTTVLEVRSRLDGKALKQFDKLLDGAGISAKALEKEVTEGAKKQREEIDKTTKSMAGYYAKIMGAAMSLKALYTEGKKSHQAMLKIEQILKSTGGAAGMTMRDIKDLTKEIKNYSGQSKSSIQDTIALGLTFTNIKKETFPDFLKRAADISVVMGTDMRTAALQLGKALNDPATGYASLKESGISFSEEQIKQIKYFQSTNQLAKAQAVILKELNVELGGSAAKLAADNYGLMDRAINAVKDAMAAFMGQLSPAVGFLGRIITFLAGLTTHLHGLPLIIGAVAAAWMSLSGAIKWSMGPLGWILTGLSGLAGILGLVSGGADHTARKTKEMVTEFQKLKRADQLIGGLKNSVKGTAQYNALQKEALQLMPQLQKELKKNKDGYTDLAGALYRVTAEKKRLNQIQAQDNIDRITGKADFKLFRAGAFDGQKKTIKQFGMKDVRETQQQIETLIRNYAMIYEGTDLTTQAFRKGFALQLKQYAAALPDVKEQLNLMIQKFVDGTLLKASAPAPYGSYSSNKSGNDKTKKSPYDASTLRLQRELLDAEHVNRALIQLKAEYLKKEDEIKKAYFADDKERARMLVILKSIYLAKYDEEQKKIQGTLKKTTDEQKKAAERAAKERAEKEYEEQKGMIDSVSGYWSMVMQAAQGDVANATVGIINKMAAQTKSAALGWAGFAIAMFKDLWSMFASKSETQLQRLQNQLEQIKKAVDYQSMVAEIASGLFGDTSTQALDEQIKTAVEGGTGKLDQLGLDFLNREDIFNLTSLMTPAGIDQLNDFYDQYNKIVGGAVSAYANGDMSYAEAQRIKEEGEAAYREQLMEFFGDEDIMNNFLLTFDYGMTPYWDRDTAELLLDSLGEAASSMETEEMLRAQREIVGYKEQIAELDHEVNSGEKDSYEAAEEKLELYNQMIDALTAYMDIAENDYEIQQQINELEEERYSIQQQINDAKNEQYGIDSKLLNGARGTQLKALLEQESQVKAMIASGKIDQSTGNALLADIERSIARELALAGADASTINSYEASAASLLSSLVGDSAYQSLASQGIAYNMSILPLLERTAVSGGSSTSTTINNNQTYNNNYTPQEKYDAQQALIALAREYDLTLVPS